MKGAANTAVRTRFAGWPKPALQFFHGLKGDNSKAFFEPHRQVYEEQGRQPVTPPAPASGRALGLRGRSPTGRPLALQGADGRPQLEARRLAADGGGERPCPAGD